MSETCPQCGAPLTAGEQCRDRFAACMVKELEEPAYYAVHHLAVAAYMLQHNAYSREGWLLTRDLLAQFVYHGLTPDSARKQHRQQFPSGQRRGSLTRDAKLVEVDQIVWTRTIADVGLDTAATYCSDVRQWAVSVLKDTEGLMEVLMA